MLTKQEIFKSKGYNVPNFVFDADGKPIEIEISENEEQSLVYDRIVGALVGAGYFRAKIKGLNPFDAIVGGMTWCLDSNSLDLDVDFLFKEDLNIGQKIALTEKIVVVLPKIKCPHFIEPHQIQGLDFIHIFPVIEWLIKWSYENRLRKAKYLEAYAVNQYYKSFTDKHCDTFQKFDEIRTQSIDYILSQYQPVRVCKQSTSSISDLRLKIESTLAEYGLSTLCMTDGYAVGPKSDIAFRNEDVQLLIRRCKTENYSKDRLNFANIDISNFRIVNSPKRFHLMKHELEILKKEKAGLESQIKVSYQELEDIKRRSEEKTVKLESLAEDEQKKVKQIQIMIQTHDKLKEEEKQFKEIFKTELNDLEQEISALEGDVTYEETEELKAQINHLQNKLLSNKLELGKIMRAVSARERLFDQIPSRAELSQYQKRFIELHYQSSAKHTETKRYFILYNILNDKHEYLKKEYNILNSIQDSYLEVVNSGGADKEEFLRQLRGIVAGINQAKEKITDKRNENSRMHKNLSDHVNYLQTLKSQYVNAVKDLSDTYKLNEKLLQRLQKCKKTAGELNEAK